MAINWPTPSFKGRTFKLCVLTRWDFNFCICSSPLRGVNTMIPQCKKLQNWVHCFWHVNTVKHGAKHFRAKQITSGMSTQWSMVLNTLELSKSLLAYQTRKKIKAPTAKNWVHYLWHNSTDNNVLEAVNWTFGASQHSTVIASNNWNTAHYFYHSSTLKTANFWCVTAQLYC